MYMINFFWISLLVVIVVVVGLNIGALWLAVNTVVVVVVIIVVIVVIVVVVIRMQLLIVLFGSVFLGFEAFAFGGFLGSAFGLGLLSLLTTTIEFKINIGLYMVDMVRDACEVRTSLHIVPCRQLDPCQPSDSFQCGVDCDRDESRPNWRPPCCPTQRAP